MNFKIKSESYYNATIEISIRNRGSDSLNSITYNVLERLKEAGGEVDLYQVCEGLGISKRILSYNLEKLNYLFERESLPAIAIENGTLKLTGADEVDYLRMRRMICDSYVLSRESGKH